MSTEPVAVWPHLLSGVRVLDLSLHGPAALAGHLVDFGAEVIKIEAPSGDYVREMTWPMIEGVSLMHLHINRGKESLVLDLKRPEAITVFEELVAQSDVIIEAMRPGFLDKRGFTRERLQEINPAIVFCAISGYGATGPYRDLPAHGIAFDTWAGLIEPIVDEHGFTRMPDQANIGITAGPAFGAMAVLAALVRARTTGKGAHMEIAQSDSAAYFDRTRIETARTRKAPDDVVSDDTRGGRGQMFESADGHVVCMVGEQSFWNNFWEGIDRDPFELAEIFRTRTTAEWLTIAVEHNIAIAAVNTPETVIHDPQFVDRFRWTTIADTGIEQLLFPLQIDGEEALVLTHAPMVGQHSADVLHRVLGYDDERIETLRQLRVTL